MKSSSPLSFLAMIARVAWGCGKYVFKSVE